MNVKNNYLRMLFGSQLLGTCYRYVSCETATFCEQLRFVSMLIYWL